MSNIQISDEDRAQLDALADEFGRFLNDLVRACKAWLPAVGEELAKVIGPAATFVQRLEQIAAENRRAHRRDYRRRQRARRRRPR